RDRFTHARKEVRWQHLYSAGGAGGRGVRTGRGARFDISRTLPWPRVADEPTVVMAVADVVTAAVEHELPLAVREVVGWNRGRAIRRGRPCSRWRCRSSTGWA